MLPPRGKWMENAFNKGLGFWCTNYSLILFYLFFLKRKPLFIAHSVFQVYFESVRWLTPKLLTLQALQVALRIVSKYWLADPCANHYRPAWRRTTSSLLLLSTVVLKMAPLDLDKYVEIARQCKYLPENDLKVTVISNYIFLSEY